MEEGTRIRAAKLKIRGSNKRTEAVRFRKIEVISILQNVSCRNKQLARHVSPERLSRCGINSNMVAGSQPVDFKQHVAGPCNRAEPLTTERWTWQAGKSRSHVARLFIGLL